jgi:hypothetical protein
VGAHVLSCAFDVTRWWQVEVLKELKESLLPMMKQLSTPKQAQQAGGKKQAKADKHAEPRNGRDERAERRAREREVVGKKGGASAAASRSPTDDENDDDDELSGTKEFAPNPRRLSAAAEEAAAAAAEAAASNDTANMAEVRQALEEVCEAEPEARSNPAVQAAYVALDNMEAEEVEAISAEAALLYKEQQTLVREIARAKHALKLAAVRLAWYDAAPDHVGENEEVPGEEHVGGGKEHLEELQARQEEEEANLARLRTELADNKAALAGLQSEVPERVVSCQRLSQLRLLLKHQQAASDALRFKQQARSAGGLMAEVLAAWEHAVPEELHSLLLEVFDLPAPAASGKSIDTLRLATLESTRAGGADGGTPATTDGAKRAAGKAASAAATRKLPAQVFDDERDDDEDDDEDDDDMDVLDGDGVATPWRTLGSLAQQAANHTPDEDDEDDEDVDEEIIIDEREPATEVVRKARDELKEARTKRLSVMQFVEEAATPKPRKSRSKSAANADAANGRAAHNTRADGNTRAVGNNTRADGNTRAKQAPLDESFDGHTISSSLPASPRAAERRNSRAAHGNTRQPLSDRTSERNATRPARAGSQPSSARNAAKLGPAKELAPKETRAAERRQSTRAKVRA